MTRRINALDVKTFYLIQGAIPDLLEEVAADKAGDLTLTVYVNVNENAIVKSYGDGDLYFDLGGQKTSITNDEYRSFEVF